MVEVEVGEGDQNHEDDRDDGEDDHADERQSEHRAVEVRVDQTTEIIFVGCDFLVVLIDLVQRAALLDAKPPGEEQGDDEEDR